MPKIRLLSSSLFGTEIAIRVRNEGFMYRIDQSHLTVFCIIFVWLGGPRSPVRVIAQVQWFLFQNWLEPSGGIYYLYKRNQLLWLCVNWAAKQQTSWVIAPWWLSVSPWRICITFVWPRGSLKLTVLSSNWNVICILHLSDCAWLCWLSSQLCY